MTTKPTITRAIAVDPKKLEPNPWNPQKTTEIQQTAIRQSLEWVDQVQEILVRPHPTDDGRYQIIDGYHRWLELQSAPTVHVNVINGLSEDEAKKLTIVMNETHGNPDKIELAQLLSEINEIQGDATNYALPYDETELQELIALADVDRESQYDDGGDYTEFPDSEYQDTEDTTVVAIVPGDMYSIVEEAYNEVFATLDESGTEKKVWGLILVQLCQHYLAAKK